MKGIEQAFRDIERQVQRHVRKLSVAHHVGHDDSILFNDLERLLLRFLKDEFLEKGGRPMTMHDPATQHRDVMERFGLDLPRYREVIGRLESLGIVDAPTIDAANGCLHIAPEIVNVVRRIDEEDSPMAAHDFLRRLMKEHGEEFEVRRDDGTTSQARGLRNHEESSGRAYIGFFAGTELQVGDALVGAVSKDHLRVIDVSSDLIHGKVLQVKAFTESEAAYQQRISQSGSSSINIGTMTNSAIQQGSPGAVQSLTFSQETRNDVQGIVDAILTTVEQLGVGEEEKADLLADAESIQAQLKKTNPNPSLIRSCLEGVKTALTKVATSAAASGTAALAKGLIEKIGNYLGGS